MGTAVPAAAQGNPAPPPRVMLVVVGPWAASEGGTEGLACVQPRGFPAPSRCGSWSTLPMRKGIVLGLALAAVVAVAARTGIAGGC